MPGKHHICLFRKSGFNVNGTALTPCQVWYHPQCIVSAPPFTSRHRKQHDLQYNPSLVVFPFVCELCTVRANVGKELLDFHNDHRFLLSLERMRMIDMFNCWARNTLVNYKSALRSLTTFQSRFGLNILNPQTPIQSFSQPSTDPAIAFGWAVLYKSILPSAQAKGDTVGFMSLRLLRSASVAYNTFVTALLQPQNHYRDRNNRLLQSNSIAPQENIASQLFLAGLAVRKGTESTKGKPLLHRHFIWNQRYRENLYQK